MKGKKPTNGSLEQSDKKNFLNHFLNLVDFYRKEIQRGVNPEMLVHDAGVDEEIIEEAIKQNNETTT